MEKLNFNNNNNSTAFLKVEWKRRDDPPFVLLRFDFLISCQLILLITGSTGYDAGSDFGCYASSDSWEFQSGAWSVWLVSADLISTRWHQHSMCILLVTKKICFYNIINEIQISIFLYKQDKNKPVKNIFRNGTVFYSQIKKLLREWK